MFLKIPHCCLLDLRARESSPVEMRALVLGKSDSRLSLSGSILDLFSSPDSFSSAVTLDIRNDMTDCQHFYNKRLKSSLSYSEPCQTDCHLKWEQLSRMVRLYLTDCLTGMRLLPLSDGSANNFLRTFYRTRAEIMIYLGLTKITCFVIPWPFSLVPCPVTPHFLWAPGRQTWDHWPPLYLFFPTRTHFTRSLEIRGMC